MFGKNAEQKPVFYKADVVNDLSDMEGGATQSVKTPVESFKAGAVAPEPDEREKPYGSSVCAKKKAGLMSKGTRRRSWTVDDR